MTLVIDDNFRDIVAVTASVCTILQFLTGIIICQKIVKNKSTGDISSFPFVSGCLSTSLWLRYGFLIDDISIILVNTIGATLFLAYVVTFFLYTIKKTVVLRQLSGCLIILIFAMILVHHSIVKNSTEEAISYLGVICCFVTILFFAAPFASLLHVIKVKSSESLPYHLILTTFLVSLQWLIYGILLHDRFIQIPNFLGCVLSSFQLSLFIIYPGKASKSYSATNI